MIYSVTSINLFGIPNMIINRQKSGDSHKFSYQCRVKIVDEVGEIPGVGKTRFNPEMTAIVLSLN